MNTLSPEPITALLQGDFNQMDNMFDTLKDFILKYPNESGLDYIKPLKSLLFEATTDLIEQVREYEKNNQPVMFLAI